MALTLSEAMKVLGTTVAKMGTEGEKYEDEHPGEKKTWSKSEIFGILIATGQELGKEVLD